MVRHYRLSSERLFFETHFESLITPHYGATDGPSPHLPTRWRGTGNGLVFLIALGSRRFWINVRALACQR